MRFRDEKPPLRWRSKMLIFAVVLIFSGVGIALYFDGFPARTVQGQRETMDLVALGLTCSGIAIAAITALSWFFKRGRR